MRQLREARGLNYELTEKAGRSRRGVIALERREPDGNLTNQYRVAKALGATMADFMSALD